MTARRAWLGAAVTGAALVACTTPPERDSCAQVIGGTWRVTAPAERAGADWAIADHGGTVELFALSRPGHLAVDDGVPPGTFAAPTAIALDRTAAPGGASLGGLARRRFTRGADVCVVKAPAQIAGCRGRTLELTLPTLPPPADLAACPTEPVRSAPSTTLTLRQLAETR